MSAINRAKYGAAAYADLKGHLPSPYPRPIGANAAAYLKEIVDSGLTIDMVGRFEAAFAARMGVKHCVSAPGCTNAIAVLAMASGFAPGDEIVVSPLADYGTVMGWTKAGIIPVFADTAPGSPNVDAKTLEACFSNRTRGILVVHKTGLPCDMDPIIALARRRGVLLFEDACQAALTRYKGRLAGTMGDAGMFSLDSEKTIGSDVGGALITNDDALAERARFMGQSRGGETRPGFGRIHSGHGLALRMPLCTAAISLAQIEAADEWVARRDRAARLICQGFATIPGIKPLVIPDYCTTYSCWMMGFQIDPQAFVCSADAFGEQCDKAGLSGASTARYYLMPDALTYLHDLSSQGKWPFSQPPASRAHRYSGDTTPNARTFMETFIRWTSFCEKYTDEHAAAAVEIVRRVAEQNRH